MEDQCIDDKGHDDEGTLGARRGRRGGRGKERIMRRRMKMKKEAVKRRAISWG